MLPISRQAFDELRPRLLALVAELAPASDRARAEASVDAQLARLTVVDVGEVVPASQLDLQAEQLAAALERAQSLELDVVARDQDIARLTQELEAATAPPTPASDAPPSDPPPTP